MADQGIDALVLLGNTNVVYATGAIWPLADAGRANFEQPGRRGAGRRRVAAPVLPVLATTVDLARRDHLHRPAYLDFDEGVAAFVGRSSAISCPTAADARRRRVDRTPCTGSPGCCFAGDRRRTPAAWSPWPRPSRPPTSWPACGPALCITEQAIAEVQARLAPGVRQTDLTATFLRTIFDAGADANMLDPIWQVMPARQADGPWTTTGDLACPLLTTERELAEGDVLWVDIGISYQGFHSDFGRTWIVGQEPDARQRDQFERWRSIIDAVLDGHPGRGHRRRPHRRRDRGCRR